MVGGPHDPLARELVGALAQALDVGAGISSISAVSAIATPAAHETFFLKLTRLLSVS